MLIKARGVRRRRSAFRPRLIESLESRTLLAAAVLPDEQLMVYLINRARHDPVAYQTEQGLAIDLSYVIPRPPLAVNDKLFASAQFHAREMANHNYFGHQSPVTGDWPNKMARDQGYNLPASFPNNSNQIESLAAGFLSTSDALDGLIVDEGVNPPGHRIHLLGTDAFNADNREIGIGYAVNLASDYDRYWAIHATRSDPANQFLTGVAFNDANGNRRYDFNEGLPNVIISAGSLSTTTNSAGGWSIPIPDGQYTVTASGGAFVGISTVPVAVNSASVEVDFISGLSVGYRNFQLAANTAPTLDNAPTTTLKPVLKNSANPPGDVIVGFIANSIHDPDPAALEGIAIFNTTGPGSWQFSTNNGSSWTNVGEVSASSALLLRDTDLVRFVPSTDFTGPATIDYRAWDRTAGSHGSKLAIASTGGSSTFSSASETATLYVLAANTAPTLNNAIPLSLPSVPEDSTNSASRAVGPVVSPAFSDPDPGTRPGIAIFFTSPASTGAWQYSLDSGSTWTPIPPVSLSAAFLLRDTDLLRFLPAPNFSGNAALSFRAWDQSTGSAGSAVDVSLPSLIGGSTAFSTAVHGATIAVTPSNDAPILNPNGPFIMTPVPPTATFPTGDTIASIVGDAISDPDPSAKKGIAVIGTAGTGTWYFNTGGNWFYVQGDIIPNLAIPLKSTDRIGFVPDPVSGSTASLTFRAWDQSTPLNPGQWYVDLSSPSSYGGSTPYSAASASATFAIANPATIKGNVFRDLNGDGVKNGPDTAVSGWAVYVDANNDSQKQSNERSATTDANGNYTIANLAPTSHYVRVITQGDTRVSAPSEGHILLTLSDGQTSLNNNFAISDALPTISILDASITEPNSATANLNFTVNLSKSSSQTITVNYATSPGSAASPSDYTYTSDILTFAPGQTSKTISVLIVGEIVFENDETFTVTLSVPTNATLADSSAIGTIRNDDQPHLVGSANPDTFYIRLDPAGNTLQFWINSPITNPPTHTASVGVWKTITIDGISGNDSATVDLVNGNPVPPSGLVINSGDIALDTKPGKPGVYDLTTQGNSTVKLAPGLSFASLTLMGTSRVSILQASPMFLRTSGLSIGATARLDIGRASLIVTPPQNSTPAQVLSQVSASIQIARLGAWAGAGLTSSAAQADSKHFTILAAAINDKGNNTPLFTTFPKAQGVAVGITDILVQYTYNGDANLDGVVNADDYFQIDSGFISQAKGFFNGDFNYDRVINADDYFLIDSSFIGQSGPLSSQSPNAHGPWSMGPSPVLPSTDLRDLLSPDPDLLP